MSKRSQFSTMQMRISTSVPILSPLFNLAMELQLKLAAFWRSLLVILWSISVCQSFLYDIFIVAFVSSIVECTFQSFAIIYTSLPALSTLLNGKNSFLIDLKSSFPKKRGTSCSPPVCSTSRPVASSPSSLEQVKG